MPATYNRHNLSLSLLASLSIERYCLHVHGQLGRSRNFPRSATFIPVLSMQSAMKFTNPFILQQPTIRTMRTFCADVRAVPEMLVRFSGTDCQWRRLDNVSVVVAVWCRPSQSVEANSSRKLYDQATCSRTRRLHHPMQVVTG